MRSGIKYFAAVSMALLIILFSGCSRTKAPEPIDPDFAGYISGFSGGVLSNQASIKVRLTEPHKDAVAGVAVSPEVFEFAPTIEGQAVWFDAQTIEFRPSRQLPSGKLFEAEFFLSRLLKVPSSLETLRFQFQVMKQAIEVSFEGVEPCDETDLEWQRLNGSALTYDYADGELTERSFVALQDGKKLPVRWEHETDGKIHRFRVDSIHRTADRGQVILQWNGEALGFEGESEKVFEIPPIGEFKVLDVKVAQDKEQEITIYFSDPVNRNQDIDGLIYLEPGSAFRTVKDANAIKLYPVNRLNGAVAVIITNALRNSMGYQLTEAARREITFTSISPAIELTGKGAIMPGTNGLVFPFRAVNLSAVNVKVIRIFENNVAQFFQVNQFDGTQDMKRVGRIVYKGELPLRSEKPVDYGRWNTFSIDLSRFINAEPGAIYRVHLSFTQAQSLYPCTDKHGTDVLSPTADPDAEELSYDTPGDNWYYDDEYSNNSGEYNYYERDDPCKPSYYMYGRRSVARNILASDLGIIAKAGHGTKLSVAVTDIRTTEPISGVVVEIYNFQQQLTGTATTGNDGLLQIDLKKKPFLLVARKDRQRGYLRLDDGSSLSLSMFDIGGQKIQKGIKGMIYGERGVWRPGDSLFLTFLLEDKNTVLPETHPVVFELYTPQNLLHERKVRTSSVAGLFDFRTATDADAPTGNWIAKVKVGSSVFSKSVKIETVKPNRLKIDLDFHTTLLKSVVKPKGELQLKWLHGAIAGNLKTDIELNLSRGKTFFKAYDDFVFDDPSKDFSVEERMIFEGKVDENGKTVISPDFQVSRGAPGMLQANFRIRAFESGGDFSIDRFSLPFSPFRGYVGIKVPEGKGWNGALFSNEPNLIPIVTVDENGKPVDRKGVIVEIYDVYWRWWWERSDEDELSSYVANKSRNLISTTTIDTRGGKAMFEMNLGKDLYGRKFIRVTDPETGHSTGQTFYVTYKGWWDNSSSENPGGAEMLSFSTDKKTYNVGEKIKVNIPAAAQGRVLVSVESGSGILKTFWLNMAEAQNNFELETTPAMAPNVYLHLTYIQPHNNVKNDLPIRLYGVQPVSVQNPASHLSPVIEMPEVLEPEKRFTVRVRESEAREMAYTLAVVDDGLLDLTRFKTPAPWNHFYAKEALSVRTWDMYKYVIGSYSGEMAGLLALGGDEHLGKNGGNKANRFKPVVKFLGPFVLSAGKENVHHIDMPNYVGSVRTMVVASYSGAYGSAEKTTPVKKPLMVLATMPRVAGPGEKIALPVTVFAMDKKVKEVSVSVQTNDLLKLNDNQNKSIRFEREGDKVVNFVLDVAETTGIAKVKVLARGGGETAVYEIELDVRASNPKVRDVAGTVIEPGESWTSVCKPPGMAGTNKGVVEISGMPSLKLEERLQYLITYPHGCIEQTVSGAFPQLFLASLLELRPEDKVRIETHVKAAIDRLRTFQITSGGLSYWPGEQNTASDWGTNYAGHFVLEAAQKGYDLPPSFFDNWTRFQKQRANSWTPDMDSHYSEGSSQLIQAYRLYTLALAKTPVMGAMNRMKALKNLSTAAQWRLAAAYFLAGRKEVAMQLIQGLPGNVKKYTELSYTYGSDERDKAMILETLTMFGLKKEAKSVFDELAVAMGSDRWYSTQTTAYSLLAVSKFIGDAATGDRQLSYDYVVGSGKARQVTGTAPVSQFRLPFNGTDAVSIKIRNTGKKTMFIKVQSEGIPATGDQTSAENNLGLSVRYLSLDEQEIDPGTLAQGTDFIAEVEVSHPGIRENYKEMALTQIFPSGWEIRNLRMDGTASAKVADQPRYQDIRDDRVLSYFDLGRSQKKVFRVLLNAAYLGEYYLPTVYCEAMYNNDINGRKAGKWVKVVEPGSAGVAQR